MAQRAAGTILPFVIQRFTFVIPHSVHIKPIQAFVVRTIYNKSRVFPRPFDGRKRDKVKCRGKQKETVHLKGGGASPEIHICWREGKGVGK
jgi:hypothetical protein